MGENSGIKLSTILNSLRERGRVNLIFSAGITVTARINDGDFFETPPLEEQFKINIILSLVHITQKEMIH